MHQPFIALCGTSGFLSFAYFYIASFSSGFFEADKEQLG